jgi:polar amino acid transport system substrate-binding protein
MRGRRRWLAVAGITALALGALLWFTWPGLETPLAVLLRRDTTWQTMQSRGTWRVGMDPSFPPFQSLDSAGRPVGFDVELAQKMAREWGLEVEIVAIGFDSLLDALKAAKVDSIVSAYPYDPRLTRDFAFSQPYFDAGLRLVRRSADNLNAVDDLHGKRVAVEWGSVGDMIGRKLQREGLDLTLVPFETPQAAVEAFVTRPELDALLVDNITLRQAQGQGLPLVAVGEPLESNPYVIVAPLRAAELQTQIDQALEELRQAGQLAELERIWLAQRTIVE